MKIAVTGASGFIGSHLCPHLRSTGHSVVEIGRASNGMTLVPTNAVTPSGKPVDLESLLTGVDAVVHLAARQQGHPAIPLTDYLEPNVALTERLLLAAEAAGVGRFVAASSRLVYSPAISGPAHEDDPRLPAGFYGLSKSIAEDLVRLHSANGPLSGVALRIGQVYGPGDRGRGVLPRFVSAVREGRAPVVEGNGRAVRDFVYVADVVSAFRLAVEQQTTAPAINIGGGGHSIRDLAIAAVVASGMGESSIRFSPAPHEDTSHYSLDCTLAASELGWAPAEPLVESVQRYMTALDRGAAD
jgi:UDP-glucose 4-epimerase